MCGASVSPINGTRDVMLSAPTQCRRVTTHLDSTVVNLSRELAVLAHLRCCLGTNICVPLVREAGRDSEAVDAVELGSVLGGDC